MEVFFMKSENRNQISYNSVIKTLQLKTHLNEHKNKASYKEQNAVNKTQKHCKQTLKHGEQKSTLSGRGSTIEG